MTISMRCQDKERLVAYLYGDQSDGERQAVEGHLAQCSACSQELRELGGVRKQLAEWKTPEIDLGFRVVREPASAGRSQWGVPAWAGLPVAATLLLAVGAAIANVELRYDASGFTVSTGWNRAASTVGVPVGTAAGRVQPAAAPAGRADDAEWRAALADMERRLRAELLQTAGRPAGGWAAADAGPGNRDPLVRQVRALIDDSERRQQRELALRLAEFARDVEAQRRADLLQIEQNVGQIEGLRATQSDMMNYIVRVSGAR